MKIDRIELFHIALPLEVPLRQNPVPPARHETVLVRLISGEAEGWGEAGPGTAPIDSHQWAAGALVCLRDWMAPLLVGQYVESGQAVQDRLAPLRGNEYAKSALDTAWWDLQARLQGRPLHRLLGASRDAVTVAVTLDVADSIDQLLRAIAHAFGRRHPHVTLKIRPGWDVEMLRAVRQVFADETIRVDGDGAYGMDQFDLLHRLEDFRPAMIQQPLEPDDLVAHAMLQDTTSTPVCLDQSITSVARAEQAIDLKSCRAVNLQPGRAGGLTPAMAILDACREAGIVCHYAPPPQTSIGLRAGLALSMLDAFAGPVELCRLEGPLAKDVAEPPSTQQPPDGPPRLQASSEPGIGVRPSLKRLKEICIAHEKLPASSKKVQNIESPPAKPEASIVNRSKR